MMDKVSIIIPVYNSQKFIRETIQSIINQSYNNFEAIIIDDCSSDESLNIIKRNFKNDKRIKIIKLNKNHGAAYSRNVGIKRASGRYIAFLDSDDLWDQKKLELQIKFMKDNNYSFSCCSYRKINENGKFLKNVIMPCEIDYKNFLGNTIIQTVGVMVDLKFINKELLYMPIIPMNEDARTWSYILKHGFNCYGFNQVCCTYRVVKHSLSSNKIKSIKQNWIWYREIEKISFFKSMYYLFGYGVNALKKRIYFIKRK